VIGSGKPYLPAGTWQLGLSARILTSDKHYNLDERQYERQERGNFVTNRQRQYELSATYAVRDDFTLTLSIPYVRSSWQINTRPGFFTGDPQTPGTDVIDLRGSGIGDISLVGRWWLGNTDQYLDENVSLGFGVKLPTGDEDDSVATTDFTGLNPMRRYSDSSVQPGTGGYGLVFDILAFKRIQDVTFSLAAAYLAEPRDTNGTPSILQTLGIPPNPAQANILVNSAPDTYFARFGLLGPVGDKGVNLSLAYRIEGSPRKDLFGGSNGFRRPGYATFLEPGVVYSNGQHTFALSIPIAHHRFRALNSTPNPVTGDFDRGDATFPDYMVLANYTYRFGNPKAGPSTPPGAVPCTPGEPPEEHARHAVEGLPTP